MIEEYISILEAKKEQWRLRVDTDGKVAFPAKDFESLGAALEVVNSDWSDKSLTEKDYESKKEGKVATWVVTKDGKKHQVTITKRK